MTNLPSSSNWQNLYTGDRSRWNDWRRILSSVLIVTLGITTAAFFSVLFATLYFEAISFWVVLWVVLVVFLLFSMAGLRWLMNSTVTFFNSLYKPPEGTNTRNLVFRRLFGVPAAADPYKSVFGYPFVVINIATMGDGKFNLENESIYWLGGPVTLIIYDGTGVYIERGNKFSRTLGPGFAFLERYERIRDIVDLRPQTIRSGQEGKGLPRPISGRTKDGIKIEFNIEIKFHILRPESQREVRNAPDNDDSEEFKVTELKTKSILEEMSRPILNPGDLQAIKKAVERTAVRRRDSKYSEVKWREGVWGTVSGKLARYVTQHYLDELLFFEEPAVENSLAETPNGREKISKAGQLLSNTMLEAIRLELDSSLQADFGVMLSSLYITSFNLPQGVREQYHRVFEVEKQTLLKRTEGVNNADTIQIKEDKRAQTQIDLITEIADIFKDIEDENFTDAVLLSLSSMLDQNLEDTAIPSMLAKENLATLQQLRDFLNNKDRP